MEHILKEYFNDELLYIKKQIIENYKPERIILFGSLAKGIFKQSSDIDLCIIKDVNDKRKVLSDMYINIDSNISFDLVLYTVDEWSKAVNDKGSFAHIIDKTGVIIYG